MIKASQIKNSFLGVIPSTILTAAKDGTPNVAYLSQVYFISDHQVALTTQFFNKTKCNLEENPFCAVRVYEPEKFGAFEIQAQYNRTENQGPLFDQLSKKFDAIADYSGSTHFFKLKAIEILDILQIESIDNESDSSDLFQPSFIEKSPPLNFESFQKVCERISAAKNLEVLFDTILQAIDLEFGFRHSMILIRQNESDRLITIATRGYGQSGVGSEVKIGEGVIGRAAEIKTPFIHASLARELLYARSASHSSENSESDPFTKAIPLPGLKNSRCQLAIPLVLWGDLLGVLFAESENINEFQENDQTLLKTLSHFIALAIHGLQMSHELEVTEPHTSLKRPAIPSPSSEKMIFSFYQKEDCLLLNGEYLIRNIPARILWLMLKQYKSNGKKEFTNRELRMEPWLQLPEVKDNLETRLILLRKRLEQKCAPVSLAPNGRGRLALTVTCDFVLTEN